MFKRLPALFFFSLSIVLTIYAQNGIAFKGEETANVIIPKLIAEAAIPGLAIAVIEKGKAVYVKGFGQCSNDTGGTVDENTVFAAASLSKPVFAYAVLQLVDEGKIELDRPLYQYLPYPDIEKDDRYKKITARMALSHSSGFPNWRRGELEILFTPGEKFQYSGEGFTYLMKVVEHITGDPLHVFMQKKVFAPLGMSRSSYIWEDRFYDNNAFPHIETGKTAKLYKNETGNSAHSLLTTATDFALFMEAYLSGKNLKKATFKAMQSPQIEVDQMDSWRIAWGLGVGLQQTKAGTAVWQWGDNYTFKCFVIGFPDKQTGIAYFTNSANGLSITEQLLENTIGGIYPAVQWNDYETFNAPSFKAREDILRLGIEQGFASFLDASGTHQDTTLLNENAMNRLAYRFLRWGHLAEALALFRMNTLAYPNSANVYDSYGEALLKNGQHPEAAKQYAKAAALDPKNKNAQLISERLTQKYSSGNAIFELEAYSNAKHVSLAGSFNDWNSLTLPMIYENGKWICRIDLEPGIYEYKFVIDGVWMPDPANSNLKSDSHNSVLEIK